MEKVSDNFLEAKKYADDLVSGKKLANIEQVQAAQRFRITPACAGNT